MTKFAHARIHYYHSSTHKMLLNLIQSFLKDPPLEKIHSLNVDKILVLSPVLY
jgi:hypothetical protein